MGFLRPDVVHLVVINVCNGDLLNIFQVLAALQTVSLELMPCVHLPKKTSQSLKKC